MEPAQKRQKLSSSEDQPATTSGELDGESTDFKLAILASLHPDRSQEVLLDYLLAYDGSINAVSSALSTSIKDEKSQKRNAINGYQSSLSSFATSSSPTKGSSAIKQLTKKGRTLHLYVCIHLSQGCQGYAEDHSLQKMSKPTRPAR